MRVRAAVDDDLPWLQELLTNSYGAVHVITGENGRDADRLPALIAEDGAGARVGLLTYQIAATGLEIVTIDAVSPHRGIGTVLLDAARAVAPEAGCSRLWLITTNDNLDALRFYPSAAGCASGPCTPGAVRPDPAPPAAGSPRTRGLRHRAARRARAGAALRPRTRTSAAAACPTSSPCWGCWTAPTRWLVGLARTGRSGTEPRSTRPAPPDRGDALGPAGPPARRRDRRAVSGPLVVGEARRTSRSSTSKKLYVNLLVTDRARQGRGLGSLLLDHARCSPCGAGSACCGRPARRRRRALVDWYRRRGASPRPNLARFRLSTASTRPGRSWSSASSARRRRPRST